jgi:hypothetical protein
MANGFGHVCAPNTAAYTPAPGRLRQKHKAKPTWFGWVCPTNIATDERYLTGLLGKPRQIQFEPALNGALQAHAGQLGFRWFN